MSRCRRRHRRDTHENYDLRSSDDLQLTRAPGRHGQRETHVDGSSARRQMMGVL